MKTGKDHWIVSAYSTPDVKLNVWVDKSTPTGNNYWHGRNENRHFCKWISTCIFKVIEIQ